MRTAMRLAAGGAVVIAGACGADDVGADAPTSGWVPRTALAEPISDNAVAAVSADGRCTLYSVLGIDASRASSGIHARGYVLDGGLWRVLPDAPGGGRIAASAVSLRGRVYVLGGYSVASTGAETSHAEVDVYDPDAGTWSEAMPLPTPIDDAVAVAWQDRWIVVVSGWSNMQPVAAVQIYDADTGAWASGTAFPGTPVFGHAGSIAGDQLVMIDGVATGPGGFTLIDQAWKATLDPTAPTVIRWESLGRHPGPARYRAAAGAIGMTILWAGGTSAPYNYDGLSYATDQPSPPLAETLTFDVASGTFGASLTAPMPTMDHRGMVGCGDTLTIIGGMTSGPRVTSEVWELRP